MPHGTDRPDTDTDADQARARPVPPRGIGLRSDRGPVLLACMTATALVALDATILSTAVPSIVADVGGFTIFPWLFSAFLLTQAVTVPLYGKVSDVVGRTPVMLTGIALFLLGSVLCGAATSMPLLVAARAVQGLGAGAIQPTSLTVIGDLYTVAERARVQGYLASVWGAASVVGPAIGGLFSEYLSWRWIFFVNVPFGIAAAVLIRRALTEPARDRSARPAVDRLGALLLAGGSAVLVLGLLEGGVRWPWLSVAGIGAPLAGVVLVVGFVLVERRASDPVLPLWVTTRRVLAGGNLVSLLVGALLVGMTSYVPTFVQVVLHSSPTAAGAVVASLTIGWPVAAALAGRVYLRIGFRDTALVGALLIAAGVTPFAFFGTASTPLAVAVACFVVGGGLGLVAGPTLVAAQSSVGYAQRGVVTGANLFHRSMGSAIGVAVFGAVVNTALGARLGTVPARLEAVPPRALSDAVHGVFVGLLVTAAAIFAAVLVVPRRTAPEATGD